MEDDDDEYGSQMDDMGLTGMTGGGRGKYGQNETGYDLATKKRKKKKKKKKKEGYVLFKFKKEEQPSPGPI
jgi:hypothetical protein